MKIKEFEALTLKDCLTQVRADLGPEAVILETRKAKKGGILGWGARDTVRIVAGTGIAVMDDERPAASRRTATRLDRDREVHAEQNPAADTINPAGPAPRRSSPDIAAFLAQHAAQQQAAPAPEEPATSAKLSQLEREMRDLRALVAVAQTPVATGHVPVVRYAGLRERLEAADVPEDMAVELISRVPDFSRLAPELREAMAEQSLRDLMAARISTASLDGSETAGQRVVALVGPTGVGKTTTIAKLAAQFALVHKKRVGLITMDTYRIAAVDQLRSYSQIIGIPLEVAHTQADVPTALERLKECDLVLIDTAGRSQKNAMQVNELKSLVELAGCETHLALSASTRERDLLEQIERFSAVGVDRLLFTKLDETNSYGTLFGVAARTGIPVSYLATGQKVPEDIERASAEDLVERVLQTVDG